VASTRKQKKTEPIKSGNTYRYLRNPEGIRQGKGKKRQESTQRNQRPKKIVFRTRESKGRGAKLRDKVIKKKKKNKPISWEAKGVKKDSGVGKDRPSQQKPTKAQLGGGAKSEIAVVRVKTKKKTR